MQCSHFALIVNNAALSYTQIVNFFSSVHKVYNIFSASTHRRTDKGFQMALVNARKVAETLEIDPFFESYESVLEQ